MVVQGLTPDGWLRRPQVKAITLCRQNMKPNETLIQACQIGDFDSAKRAIDIGAHVNASDGDYTPIHWAVQEGYVKIIGLLLDNGADINSHDEFGFTPLQKAVGENNPKLVRYLIRKGADIDDWCNGQGTALHTACAYGLVECTNILLDSGADVTILDDEGKSAMDYAMKYGYTNIASIINESTAQQKNEPDS